MSAGPCNTPRTSRGDSTPTDVHDAPPASRAGVAYGASTNPQSARRTVTLYEVAPGGHWHTEDRAASRWHVCEDVVIPRADHLAGAAEPLYPDRDTPGWHVPDVAHVAADPPPSLSHGAITP